MILTRNANGSLLFSTSYFLMIPSNKQRVLKLILACMDVKYPRVRRFSAEKMYERLLILGQDTELWNLLLKTSWDSDLYTDAIVDIYNFYAIEISQRIKSRISPSKNLKTSVAPTHPEENKGFTYGDYVHELSQGFT